LLQARAAEVAFTGATLNSSRIQKCYVASGESPKSRTFSQKLF
jgi:hypothetical protein